MATTYQEYTGNASATTFSYPFPVLKTEDIKVALNGVTQTTGYTATTSPAQVVFSSAPASGVVVRVYRDTDVDAAKGVFAAGSSIRAVDLNNNQDQVLYALQEEQNQKGIFESISLEDDKKIYFGNGDDASIDWDTDGWTDRLEIKSAGDTYYYVGSGNAHAFFVDSALPFKVDGNEVDVRVDVKPYPSNAVDLGKSDRQFKDLYIDGTGYIDTLNADSITGSCIVDSGTSTSNSEVYSAKRAGEIFYQKGTLGEIQSGETWVADDSKVATTAAIDARIVDLVDDVGGFVPIANETSFPNANPDVNNGAGTLISVPLSNNITSNGSGVISISNGTVGNSTVTINGAAASTTYSTGFGIIVETTTTLNTYNFHRYVPKATEVTAVAGSIANVNTTAGAIANVNTVAGISGNVTTVAGVAANVTTVAGVAANVTTVAGVSTHVPTVAGIASNVTTVAGISSDVTAVAGDAADIGACSTNIGSIAAIGSDLANNFENITDYGAITGAVTSTSGTSDITTVANSIANVNAVGPIAANVTTVAGISANVTSVAGNATNINTCATNISAITGASTQATNAATSATNAASSATTASTQATNASTSATSAASSATTATSQASTATTQASNASTSASNALAYRNTTLIYRNDASAILTQVESAPYNLSDSASTHTAWGNITDTGANAVFTNESSNTLLTMAEGSSSYNYGSIT